MISAGYLRDEDLNFECLVFRDEAGATLEVQRSLEFEDQDRSLGMDTYCIVSSSGASHYGALTSWQITGATLLLDLTVSAADELGLPARLSIPLDDQGVALVREHLQRILTAS